MNINKIVIHCSDSPNDRGDTAQNIHQWHLERGFDGIGYHYVVLPTGDIENGRPEYWQGAHVRGHNKGSIGICLIGVDDFTRDQLTALRYLIMQLIHKHPLAEVFGHRDLDPNRTCPNFDVKEWLYNG